MKYGYIILSFFLIAVLVIPSLIVITFNKESKSQKLEQSKPYVEDITQLKSKIMVSVYRTEKKEIEKVPLEEYIEGVVASEMPVNFELEALKAQALSARTYIVKTLLTPMKDSPQNTNVTDSSLHQVYKDKDELKVKWGKNYDRRIKKIAQAVSATQGQIITFEGKPIDASFFSTSNGYTENSEDYWKESIPYLRSVPSPWDKSSPKFSDYKVLPISNLESKLGVNIPEEGAIGTVKRTSSHRVAFIEISGKKYEGKKIRELLGLNSSDFTLERKDQQVVITSKGYGHGVGMSQYGANSMAKEGKNYKDIVSYYYKDIKINDLSSLNDVEQLIVKVRD